MDPDPPTRRIPPQEPLPPPRGTVRETEYVTDPEREQLRDRVRSLTTALLLVGLLATVALGAALYALLAEDDEDDTGRRGASPARVSNLEDRIQELDGRIDDRATKSSVDELEERLGNVGEQAEQAGETGDTQALRDSIEALDQSVQGLEQRVESLEQADTGGATTEP